jgi:hypothetical protein
MRENQIQMESELYKKKNKKKWMDVVKERDGLE